MNRLLDLIAVPDAVDALREGEGRDVLEMFEAVNRSYPEFFPYLAQMAGFGMPASQGDGGEGVTDLHAIGVNEGKRVLGIELLAILKVAVSAPHEADETQ